MYFFMDIFVSNGQLMVWRQLDLNQGHHSCIHLKRSANRTPISTCYQELEQFVD